MKADHHLTNEVLWRIMQTCAQPDVAAAIHRVASRRERKEPVILGVDQGLPGGDFTGYACSCGQVRVEPDGPCEWKDCPIRSIDGRAKKEGQG